MAYENVTLQFEGAVAVLTINRPKALNALNKLTFDEIEMATDEIAARDDIKAVVVTGAGDKAFVAGADITEFMSFTGSVDWMKLSRRGDDVMGKLEKLGKPVIAALNGFTLGGGLELALSCDIRIAADTAKMGIPEINLGLIPGYGATQRLTRLLGRGMAKKLAFTGDMVDAETAFKIGLVEEVVPAAELMDKAMAFAKKLAQKAPIAMMLAKRSIDDGMDVDLERGMAIETANFALAGTTQDCKEGTTAFLEKRKPEFKGR